MSPTPWIPLVSIYVKQGINIAGHQNRIYDTGPTWVLHLHPQGTLVSLRFLPEQSTHYISTTQIECMQAMSDAQIPTESQPSVQAPSQLTGRSSDSSGLIANQVRHQIKDAPVYAVSGAEVLDPSPQRAPGSPTEPPISVPSEPALDPVNQPEIAAKQEHFAPQDQAPIKKKRGRPRKVAPPLASTGASF